MARYKSKVTGIVVSLPDDHQVPRDPAVWELLDAPESAPEAVEAPEGEGADAEAAEAPAEPAEDAAPEAEAPAKAKTSRAK